MDKVIMIKGSTVSIGKADGSLRDIDIDAFNFVPRVGDKVKVYENEGKILVVKDEPEPEQKVIKETVIVNQEAKSGTKVSKLTYALLAIFLGGIGAHKFYAGKVFQGILYLIFCWTGIPAIIALIEFVVALCKDADAQGNIYV